VKQRASIARAIGGPAGAVALLIAISVARFVWPDAQGTMLFAVVPVAALGMMLGARVGLLAALAASAVTIVWAAVAHHLGRLEFIGQPLSFFMLGGISGYFAKGALGDYDFDRARICSRLRAAITGGEIGMHYQPVVRSNGELLLVEALCRWHDPDRGTIPPLDFIPSAEFDDRTIRDLTFHTIERVLSDTRPIDGPVTVAVNLSPIVLRQPGFAEAMEKVIGTNGPPATPLAVEVTETAISTEDEQVVIESLSALKRNGIGLIAIDDFGIGHSSLARLGRLPIDVVKIDRALIADSAEPNVATVIQGMIELAHAVDLTVVAEGVEDAKTWEFLVDADCDAIQGYHLSRPMPPNELPGWLEAHERAARS